MTASAPAGRPHGPTPGGNRAAALDIEVVRVDHYFRAAYSSQPVHAVGDVLLRVPEGQFVAVVGASGCGRTTSLNMMADLIQLRT